MRFSSMLISAIVGAGVAIIFAPQESCDKDKCEDDLANKKSLLKDLVEEKRLGELEASKEISRLNTENSILKAEFVKNQSESKTIPDYNKVTFNGYTFQIPSSWTADKNEDSETSDHTYFKLLENGEEIATFRCPIKETGYELEMSFHEYKARYTVLNDKMYKFEENLMQFKEDDVQLGIIYMRPALDEPWLATCTIAGFGNFDIYRNIYSSLSIDESKPPEMYVIEE